MHDELNFSAIAMSGDAHPAAMWTIAMPWGSWMRIAPIVKWNKRMGLSSYREWSSVAIWHTNTLNWHNDEHNVFCHQLLTLQKTVRPLYKWPVIHWKPLFL